MLSFTQDSLIAALTLWNRGSSPQYVGELPAIIQRAELALMRALDLDSQHGDNDTTTTPSATEVFKPDELINEDALWVTVDGIRTALVKRSRDWCKYVTRTPGTPLFYCELDETRWEVAPPALAAYLVEVTGTYFPASIMDGDGTTVTWSSTNVPDLLFLACMIESTSFLKFMDRNAALVAEFTAKVAVFRGESPNNDHPQGADDVSSRQDNNPAKGPGA